jgi:hypothetical protein
MSNENQKPTFSTEQASRSDNNNPFLNEPLPQGTRKVSNNHYNKVLLIRKAIMSRNTTSRVVQDGQVTSVKLPTSAIKP